MMDCGGIINLTKTLSEGLKKHLPCQRETQREILALLTGTMLFVILFKTPGDAVNPPYAIFGGKQNLNL